MFWMGGLRGDPTLRKEVKNDYKKGQSHKRWEEPGLRGGKSQQKHSDLALSWYFFPFTSFRFKNDFLYLWHIYVTRKEKRLPILINRNRLKDEAFQCEWFLVQFEAGQKEALIQANDLFSWFNLPLPRLRHSFIFRKFHKRVCGLLSSSIFYKRFCDFKRGCMILRKVRRGYVILQDFT